MDFEWDERKNQSNIKKHGVSFDEAKEVFGGCPVVYFDADAAWKASTFEEMRYGRGY